MESRGGVQFESVIWALWNVSGWLVSYLGSLDHTWIPVKQKSSAGVVQIMEPRGGLFMEDSLLLILEILMIHL